MKNEIIFRNYIGQDKEQLLDLAKEFSNFYVPINPWSKNPIDPSTPAYFLDKLLKNVKEKNGQIIVAENSDLLVGFIGAYLTDQSLEEKLEFIPMKLGYISELFVLEEYRSQGIGDMLLTKAHEYLKEKGCTYVELEVFAPNTRAHEFYLKHKYIDKNISMIKSLS